MAQETLHFLWRGGNGLAATKGSSARRADGGGRRVDAATKTGAVLVACSASEEAGLAEDEIGSPTSDFAVAGR